MKYAARKIDCQVWISNLLMAAKAMPPITIDALKKGELEEQVARSFEIYRPTPQQAREAALILLELGDRIEEGAS